MYAVHYKYQFEPVNKVVFDTKEEAEEFAKGQRLKGWDAVVQKL